MKNKDLIVPIFLMPVTLARKMPGLGQLCFLIFLPSAPIVGQNPDFAIIPLAVFAALYFGIVAKTISRARSEKGRAKIRQLWKEVW